MRDNEPCMLEFAVKIWTQVCFALAFALSGCTIVVVGPPDGGTDTDPLSPGGNGQMAAGGGGGQGGSIGAGGAGSGPGDVGPRCGNMICDPNEDCRCADCACEGVCGRMGDDWLCGERCDDDEACPGEERCFEGFPAFEGPACLPAPDANNGLGDACDNSLDCGPGLVCSCSDNWNCPGGSVCVEACTDDCDRCQEKRWGTRVCDRDCDPDNPDACAPGSACVASATDTGCTRPPGGDWVCYPRETRYHCAPGVAPAFGEACGTGRSCDVNGACVGTTCEQTDEGVGCDVYQCSRPCDDASDCEDPQAECWRASTRDLGYCVPRLN